MSISVFLSTVTDEFGAYRVKLEGDLTRHDVAVKVQERFKDLGGDTLDKLDTYVAHCDAVVHLVGEMCGAAADARQQEALVAKYPDLPRRLPPLGGALGVGAAIPYTHWEAWLALYHKKPLMIAKAGPAAPRGPRHAPTDGSRASQAAHLERLKAVHRYPGCEFENPDDLAKHIAYSAILDLLVKDYAEKTARERDIAEGFIKEMAKRVASDNALDFDGMKQAVENAIEIYAKEIAGRPVETNLDDIVGRALARAKEQVDKGQSALARATLRRAAEEMKRDEEERRERYVAGVTALHKNERDIALASYDGEAAAGAILALAEAIHGANAAAMAAFLHSEAETLETYGSDRGSNVHLIALIASRRKVLTLALSGDERGVALLNLGIALGRLGERESGTERLEEAVAAYRAALEEWTRERVPLDWAATQNNLGNALLALGDRESGTARLEQAVTVYRAALEESTRERVPLHWATTQSNLGNALLAFGERESGTARLEEAVAAYRAALEEQTRERIPLDWARTQNSLGNALLALGEREGGTARLEEAVAAYRSALEERTRERVPLDWALTQNNLGNALKTLGERESGTARFEEAVAAYRAALEEQTRERVPLDWAMTQNNLGSSLARLGQRDGGTARLEEAVDAYRAALEEGTRERVPLHWAATQNNLGNALMTLGERESGTARLEEAVAAYRAALREYTHDQVQLNWAYVQHGLANALAALGKRQKNAAPLEEALGAARGAVEVYQEAGEGFYLPIAQRRVADMEAELAEMKARTKGDG
jgi:tetratricopeptide (TPR) repeat protein